MHYKKYRKFTAYAEEISGVSDEALIPSVENVGFTGQRYRVSHKTNPLLKLESF